MLLEIARLLGEYRNDIVLVGGWVPQLLLAGQEARHVGRIDVDLALNHRGLGQRGYRSIRELLLARAYRPGKQPFVFHRTVQVADRVIEVEVDFLAGEYAGTGRRHRTQRAQDMQPRKARGVDLAFAMPETVTIRGRLPEGGEDVAEVQVASVPAFLVMKGMALKTRLKEKDAWDIYYCVRHYPGGLEALVQDLRPLVGHGLDREALRFIGEKFASPSHVGPADVADFEEIDDPSDRAFIQRDAYERIQYLLRSLGIE